MSKSIVDAIFLLSLLDGFAVKWMFKLITLNTDVKLLNIPIFFTEPSLFHFANSIYKFSSS